MTSAAERKIDGPAVALLETPSHKIMFANAIFRKALGATSGMCFGEGLPTLIGVLDEAVNTQKIRNVKELCALKPDGEPLWSVQAIPLDGAGSVPGMVLLVATNISAQAALTDKIETQNITINENNVAAMEHGVTIDRQTETIEQQARLLKLLMVYVPWGVIIADNQFQITRMSEFGRELLGNMVERRDGGEPGEENITINMFHESGEQAHPDEMPLRRAITKAETIIGEKWFVPDETGRKRRALLCNAAPMRNDKNETIGGITTFGDITPLKDMLVRSRELVDQKDVLLSELHHRVKNSLQVISSVAMMEKLRHPEAATALDNVVGHIQAVAAIHETLGLSNDVSRVPFGAYIRKICEELRNLYRTTVKMSVSGMEELPLDVAAPLGLIVNELLSNSLKHAFDKDAQGVIGITLDTDETSYYLEISDNGVGLPEPYLPSLGMRLVKSLVHQIGGVLQTNSIPELGTTWRISFPINAKNREIASR
jgi:two-component sensor histidine kinase